MWAFIATHSPTTSAPRENKYILVEVDPISKTNEKSKSTQVVQTEKGARTQDVAPDAFLGEQNQRVEKQSVSVAKNGTAPKASRPAKQTKEATEASTTKETVPPKGVITATGALAKFGIAIGNGKEESPKPQAAPNPIEEGSMTAQARGEYVKGFKEGEKTMLNTREFVFYGYFQRIREKLDRAWEKSLREQLMKYYYRGRQLASETDYVSQLLVSLDKDGHVTKVQIIGSAGTTDLDEAATKAFNDAGPFPNPPSGLVDTGGQVLVRWDFVLKT
ncbi:MAG: TonB family protein [Bdellovibrionales bacterium]|nr:TonB family protein [Bdellovibrionales bacterium]